MTLEKNPETTEEKPFYKVIVHSFFVIPFLIAVFCLLLFTAVHMLTREQRTVYDYLEDVKTGGVSKRWQGAFELSRILANPKLVPKDERFTNVITAAFKQSQHDDDRVREYLALAMGRTGDKKFAQPLIDAMKEANEDTLSSLIYALGMLKSKNAVEHIATFLDHPNARIRSIAVVALGNIGDDKIVPLLQKSLGDVEPNVQWGAAVSLAQMGNNSGKDVLFQLMQRDYLKKFSEVDSDEQTNLILMAIDASTKLNESSLQKQIKLLADSDESMKIRTAALKTISKSKLN